MRRLDFFFKLRVCRARELVDRDFKDFNVYSDLMTKILMKNATRKRAAFFIKIFFYRNVFADRHYAVECGL